MKLAEALQARSDMNKRITQLRQRIDNQTLVQEGEEPDEDPRKLLDEHDRLIASFAKIVADINLTNAKAIVDGVSLTALIARRDALAMQAKTYQSAINECGNKTRRASQTEIRIMATLKVTELQKKLDDIQRDIRLTDNKIQENNWLIDLIES